MEWKMQKRNQSEWYF